jgi:hypothetical protein
MNEVPSPSEGSPAHREAIAQDRDAGIHSRRPVKTDRVRVLPLNVHNGWMRINTSAVAVAVIAILSPAVSAEPVNVRTREGLVHGFLALRTLEGKTLAHGDLVQTAKGDRVSTRLTFHFADGSLHDETAVYWQRRQFQLISDHVVQKGPAFKLPMESTIDVQKHHVTVRYKNDEGEDKVIDEGFDAPPDLANGLILTLLKNISPEVQRTTVSMLALTPKPRLVKLDFVPSGEETFTTAGLPRKATHFLVKVDIGGVMGVLADLLDKVPPDSSVWILGGEAPAFVKSEAPLFLGGPLWRIELVSPEWR